MLPLAVVLMELKMDIIEEVVKIRLSPYPENYIMIYKHNW